MGTATLKGCALVREAVKTGARAVLRVAKAENQPCCSVLNRLVDFKEFTAVSCLSVCSTIFVVNRYVFTCLRV